MGRPGLSSNGERQLPTSAQEGIDKIERLKTQGSELFLGLGRAARSGKDPREYLPTDPELSEAERRRFVEAVDWAAKFFDLDGELAGFVAVDAFHSAARAKALSLENARNTDEAGQGE